MPINFAASGLRRNSGDKLSECVIQPYFQNGLRDISGYAVFSPKSYHAPRDVSFLDPATYAAISHKVCDDLWQKCGGQCGAENNQAV
jgi:hypothetical protein